MCIRDSINPANDWVIIGSKEEIEIYCEIESDFEKIENALSFLERKFIRKPYNRQLDFPKRRPVSYTHLDVYKRQPLGRRFIG